MSLKAFHLVFVLMATTLAVVYAVWAFRTFLTSDSAAHAAGGLGAVTVACGLVSYGATTFRKFRRGTL